MLPIDIQKTNESTLSISWDNGQKSFYNLKELRKNCPCASCNALRNHPLPKNPLRVLSEKEALQENLTILEAEIIGRYAVQFKWSDNHHEGIYTFDYLLELAEQTVPSTHS